jgi:hypothetical protein
MMTHFDLRLASNMHKDPRMDMNTVRVRPLVRGWKVEAEGARATHRETMADALHVAHCLTQGTLQRIVVLDEKGEEKSRFPFAEEVDGA